MAGEDQSFLGEAFPAAGISVGFLHQEPRLNLSKDARNAGRRCVNQSALTRYDEVERQTGRISRLKKWTRF
jgi:hypothetical protein